MGHSSAASAQAGESIKLIVFCQVQKDGVKELLALLRNCKQSISALTGAYRCLSQDGRNKYGDYCLQQEETHPKITESVKKVASLWRQIIVSSCVDLNINIGSVALNQGCGNSVLENHNPARVSVLPGRKQPSPRQAGTLVEENPGWIVAFGGRVSTPLP